MYYVYLLKLSNGSFYTGFTADLKARMTKHSKGEVRATKGLRPVELVHYSAFHSKITALKLEKYLKSGSGQAFRNRHLL